jgi:hypothetical protein
MVQLENPDEQIKQTMKDRIDAFVDLHQEETLHLEFKTLSSDKALTRDDRKVLAKAICGLANAEGGQVVVGIETKKIDGVDVASRKKPMNGLERLRRLITAAVPEILSPQHRGISVSSVLEAGGADQGYLVIDVPSSDDRPHMSVTERRYFRRGSDGTRVLDHAEIRELMLAPREGRMQVRPSVRVQSSTGDLRYSLDLFLILQNVVRVPIVAPYIKTAHLGWRTCLSGVMSRNGPEGSFGFYGSRDLLIHVDDQIALIEISTGLDFRRTGLYDLKAAISAVAGQPHSFQMLPVGEMPTSLDIRAQERPIEIACVFGAENVAAESFEVHIGKQELLSLFCKDPNIARQLSP